MPDMLYNIGGYVVFGLVLVGLIVLYWYLQPRKLPPNPETDSELRPSSNRTRQEAGLNRMRLYFFGRYPAILPRREISDTEKERQSQLSRSEENE